MAITITVTLQKRSVGDSAGPTAGIGAQQLLLTVLEERIEERVGEDKKES